MSKVAIATQKLLNSSGYTTFIRKKGTNLSIVSVKQKGEKIYIWTPWWLIWKANTKIKSRKIMHSNFESVLFSHYRSSQNSLFNSHKKYTNTKTEKLLFLSNLNKHFNYKTLEHGIEVGIYSWEKIFLSRLLKKLLNSFKVFASYIL